MTSAQVLLTFFDMSARTHYLNARQTLRKLLEWRVLPVINENDTTTTDEISFGDNDFLAAQVAMLLGAEQLMLLTDTDGAVHGRPAASTPSAQLVSEVRDFAALEELRDRPRQLAAGVGRDALQGGGGRDGDRGGDRDGDLQRPGPRDDPLPARGAGEPRGHALRAPARRATRASSCG